MVVQHNIPALNSYNRLGSNNKAVASNLKKLSSGYKINSAADNAAGLAISEKMRAQITGLEAAQQNAKDGISLVQTAEGALTEVHSMLNRMVELSTLASNGTYSDSNREKYQNEIQELKDEINRIADSTNFNGINLLDGSLDGSVKADPLGPVYVTDKTALKDYKSQTTATKSKFETSSFSDIADGEMKVGDKITVSFDYLDADGKAQTKTLEYTLASASDGTAKATLKTSDGTTFNGQTTAAKGTKLDKAEIAKQVVADLKKDKELSGLFDIQLSTDKVTFESVVAGSTDSAMKIAGAKVTYEASGIKPASGATTKEMAMSINQTKVGEDMEDIFDLSKLKAYDTADTADELEDSVVTIGDKRFIFLKNGTDITDSLLKKLKDADITNYVVVADTTAANQQTITKTEVAELVEKANMAFGKEVLEQGAADAANGGFVVDTTPTNTVIKLKANSGIAGTPGNEASNGKALNLQIADTADDFNRLEVSVQDCHAKALGVADIDVSTEKSAAEGITSIKNAIDTVSKVRAKLGATQNRLDHTLNNLETTTENLTESESRIRDTDMAKEMMQYTKNNILVQSSQAMLAQANQLPQGVLQLLQ